MPLGKEVGLGPGHIVLDGDSVGTLPPTAAPPHFRPMPIVAKRSPISANAELLYKRLPKKSASPIHQQRSKLVLGWNWCSVEMPGSHRWELCGGVPGRNILTRRCRFWWFFDFKQV